MNTLHNLIGEDDLMGNEGGRNTWFRFLQLSRAIKGKRGGWNKKTHWSKRGLDRLAPGGRPAAFLTKWTETSLLIDVPPKPREGDFQFGLRLADLKKGERGGSGSPSEGSENAINWRLAQNLHRLGQSFSYEVPLADDSNGQLKVDLMIFHGEGRVEIIELKGTSRNPNISIIKLSNVNTENGIALAH